MSPLMLLMVSDGAGASCCVCSFVPEVALRRPGCTGARHDEVDVAALGVGLVEGVLLDGGVVAIDCRACGLLVGKL